MKDRKGDKMWTAVNRDVWMWKGTDEDDQSRNEYVATGACRNRQTGKHCNGHTSMQTDISRERRGSLEGACVPSLLYLFTFPSFASCCFVVPLSPTDSLLFSRWRFCFVIMIYGCACLYHTNERLCVQKKVDWMPYLFLVSLKYNLLTMICYSA